MWCFARQGCYDTEKLRKFCTFNWKLYFPIKTRVKDLSVSKQKNEFIFWIIWPQKINWRILLFLYWDPIVWKVSSKMSFIIIGNLQKSWQRLKIWEMKERKRCPGLCSEVRPGSVPPPRFLISRPRLWILQQFSVASGRYENQTEGLINAFI